jgi:hypothetical protein
MADIQVQLRRGTATQHDTFTGAVGEVTVDTTNETLRVHDGSTVGGVRLAKLSEAGGSGTVTSVDSGTGLTGGPITASGTLSIADDGVTAAKISSTDNTFKVAANEVVINEGGADVNFRVEGDTNANLINADAGEDIVGIGVNINTSDTFDGTTTYKAQVKDGLRVNNATGVAKLKLITDKSGGGGASITLKSTTPPATNEGDYSIFIGGANGKFNIKNELAAKTILMDADGDWSPLASLTQDLGKTGSRWDDVWSNGTFNGSDRNIKQDIQDLDEVEKRVAVKCKGLIKKYRMKDAVAKKGNDARIHVGIIAQELQAAFESEGLDPFRYSMIGKDTWWEGKDSEGNRDVKYEATGGYTKVTQMSVRYNELLAFIISAM